MKKLLLLITIGAGSISFAQTPCENGMAGVYPCNGLDLMSRVSLDVLSMGQNVDGNDSWGWTDPESGKEIAIMGFSRGTGFVDISDPVNPIYLGKINTQTSESVWRDIKVYNNHAFIVADAVGEHGMQVFDLTRLRSVTEPQVFTPDHVYHGVSSCHNIVINEAKPYAYLVGCGNNGGGPIIVNISDPLNPFEESSFDSQGYSHDAQVVTYNGPDADYQGKEILIGSNGAFGSGNKVVFVDVTDASNPTLISTISYNAPGYTHQGWLTDNHEYFILGDELDEMDYGHNTRTVVFDVRDLDNPTVSSTYFGATEAIDHNGYVKGNKFYLANYTAGLRVMDISNIGDSSNSMQEVAFFDTFQYNNHTDFDGAWSTYPYFASGNIIVSDMSNGLFVVRPSVTMATQDLTDRAFQLIPNPATDFVQIKAASNQKIESVQLLNLVGQEIFTQSKINQLNYQVNLKSLPKGVYVVRINQSITKKLVVK